MVGSKQHDDTAAAPPESFDAFLKDVAQVSEPRPSRSTATPRSELRWDADLEPGRPEIVRRLGQGGMGVVHAALDPSIGREVALKELVAELENDDHAYGRFVNEARITGQLQHPGVVPVYALARGPSGAPYFTMQVVEGCTLREWLASPGRELGARERVEAGIEIVLRVCDALSFAHSRGVLHRDVKPDNVMVGPHGRVYLMDWGLATTFAEGARQGSSIAGTLPYMAPEQARGDGIDERADVFGVGAVLYEIVSGRTPYDAQRRDLGRRVVAGEVVPLADALGRAQASPLLTAIVDRAVAPARGDRMASVAELGSELRRFLRGGLHLPRRTARAEEVILRQGDPGDAAYLILEGACRVVQTVGGRDIELSPMGPGEVFGEMALLLDEPRTATVTAAEDTALLVIDREALKASGALEGWTSTLLAALAKRFRELERKVREG